MDIPYLRLKNEHLTQSIFTDPHDIVSWLGAVQAQDYAMAKWALGLRLKNATDETIENALNEGSILRTHVMRPTWHFVVPEDIRWMLELTAPRINTILAHYDRRLELTDDVLSRCHRIIARALEGKRYLTRKELAEHLEKEGIPARGQRLGHIVAHAELDALICNGPRRGKQFTYALLDERVPKMKKKTRDESLATLAGTYFMSHGPAQLKDFAWWSGLTIKDALRGLEHVKPTLEEEVIDGKTYWFSPDRKVSVPKNPMAFLLSIYDEYTIAYKDRSALGGERYVETVLAMGNAFTTAMIYDGKIVGTWKRVIKKDVVEIKLNAFEALNKEKKEAFRKSADRYGVFLDMPAKVV